MIQQGTEAILVSIS